MQSYKPIVDVAQLGVERSDTDTSLPSISPSSWGPFPECRIQCKVPFPKCTALNLDGARVLLCLKSIKRESQASMLEHQRLHLRRFAASRPLW